MYIFPLNFTYLSRLAIVGCFWCCLYATFFSSIAYSSSSFIKQFIPFALRFVTDGFLCIWSDIFRCYFFSSGTSTISNIVAGLLNIAPSSGAHVLLWIPRRGKKVDEIATFLAQVNSMYVFPPLLVILWRLRPSVVSLEGDYKSCPCPSIGIVHWLAKLWKICFGPRLKFEFQDNIILWISCQFVAQSEGLVGSSVLQCRKRRSPSLVCCFILLSDSQPAWKWE